MEESTAEGLECLHSAGVHLRVFLKTNCLSYPHNSSSSNFTLCTQLYRQMIMSWIRDTCDYVPKKSLNDPKTFEKYLVKNVSES